MGTKSSSEMAHVEVVHSFKDHQIRVETASIIVLEVMQSLLLMEHAKNAAYTKES